VALDHIFYTNNLLEGVDVLGVVPQQFLGILHCSDKLMTWGGFELTRVDLTCKLEEWSGIFPKVVNVKHGLRVWQIREVLSKSCVDAVLGSEVRNTTGDRDPSSCQDDDVGTLLDQLNTVLQGVHGGQLGSPWRLREKIEEHFPQSHGVNTLRNLTAWRQHVVKNPPRILSPRHGSVKPGKLSCHVWFPLLPRHVRQTTQAGEVVISPVLLPLLLSSWQCLSVWQHGRCRAVMWWGGTV